MIALKRFCTAYVPLIEALCGLDDPEPGHRLHSASLHFKLLSCNRAAVGVHSLLACTTGLKLLDFWIGSQPGPLKTLVFLNEQTQKTGSLFDINSARINVVQCLLAGPEHQWKHQI